jgi:large subunit ribosomal protein L25
MSAYVFTAKIRQGHGKAYAAGLRREGKVPGVLYGHEGKPQSVEVSEREIEGLITKTLGANALLTMKLDPSTGSGQAPSEETVMFKDIQRDPVKTKLVHIDFYHVDPKHPLKLKIPVETTGTSVGVKDGGGILQKPRRFLNVRCLSNAIPHSIKVDISNVGLDQSILLQDLAKIPGVEFLDDPHSVLAHVAAIEEEAAAAPAAAAGEAPAQPEVIGEKEREAKRAEKEGASTGSAQAPSAEGGKAPAKGAAPAAPAKK